MNDQNSQFDHRWFRPQREELFVNKENKKEQFARETVSLKFVIHVVGLNLSVFKHLQMDSFRSSRKWGPRTSRS